MSQDPLMSYLQVLDSINDLRQTIALEVGGENEFSQPVEFWEAPADGWFDDCDFDSSASIED